MVHNTHTHTHTHTHTQRVTAQLQFAPVCSLSLSHTHTSRPLSVLCVVFVLLCSGCWLLYNDARVNVVTPEKVLESQAYLLFYKRRDPSD
jgi:hypothetical protein